MGDTVKKNIFAILAGSALALTAASASADDIGVNLKIGTLGPGVELSKGLSDKLSIGLGFNSYKLKTSETTSDVSYDFKFQLQTVALLANYHPFAGMLRLTGGVMYNNNELSLTGKPSGANNYTINGQTYTAAQVGSLTGKLGFNTAAPYLGSAWGTARTAISA